MSTLTKITAIFVCCSLIASDSSAGGPFSLSRPNKLSDLFMVMTATYALGMTSREQDFDGTIELGLSVLGAQLATEGIKSLELERRPNGSDYKSFPSGHAAAAFSSAMFVHRRYGWKSAIVPYAMAGITGWGRVAADAHYWHDVLGGAAVSALFTWLVVDKYDVAQNITLAAGSDDIHIGFKTAF